MNAVVQNAPGQAVCHLDHLSHSQVQGFTTCPRQWWYRVVAKAAPEQISAALAFGSALHEALAAVNEAGLAGETINAPMRFTACWEAALAGPVPVVFGRQGADELQRIGLALVGSYRPPENLIGVEQPFRVTIDPDLPPVVGRIDLIYRDAGGDLVLADLKTAASSHLPEEHSLGAQLALYDLAYPAVRHEAIVLTKLKTPTVRTHSVTPWPIHRLIQHYQEVAHAMCRGCRFAVRGWACATCPYQTHCAHEGSDGHG